MARYFVVVGFIQGCLLLLLHEAAANKWHVFSMPEFAYPAYALVLVMPVFGLLSIHLVQGWRFAKYMLAVSILLLCLSWYSGYLALPITSDSFAYIFVVTIAMLTLMYISLPFLQSYFKSGQVKPSYKHLYEYGWLNTTAFMTAALFTGLAWAVLALWAALFALLNISLFSDIFFNHYFVYPATGVMMTYGVSLGIQRFNISMVQQTDYLFRAVTGIISLLVILFALALIVSGLEPLWSTKKATLLLLCLQMSVVLFVNGMFQQGYQNRKEALVLRWSVSLLLVIMPLFTLICIYAMYLRVEQYGWTIARVWAAIVIVLLSIYAFGYALAAIRGFLQKGTWLAWVAPTNIVAALTIVLIIIATHSPLMSPIKIGVASQVSRLMEAKVKAKDFDFRYLQASGGEVGLEKLRDLSQLEGHPESAEIQRLAKQALTFKSQSEITEALSKARIDQVFAIRPQNFIPDELLEKFLYEKKGSWPYVDCFTKEQKCTILFVDLNQDDVLEAVIFNKNRPYDLLKKESNGWIIVGSFDSVNLSPEAEKMLEKGRFTVKENEWRNLKIGDATLYVSPK